MDFNAGSSVGRQRATTWPPPGRISWPPTGVYRGPGDDLAGNPEWFRYATGWSLDKSSVTAAVRETWQGEAFGLTTGPPAKDETTAGDDFAERVLARCRLANLTLGKCKQLGLTRD